MLADMATRIEAARLMVYTAAARAERMMRDAEHPDRRGHQSNPTGCHEPRTPMSNISTQRKPPPNNLT